MSERPSTCDHCGIALEPTTGFCPRCGVAHHEDQCSSCERWGYHTDDCAEAGPAQS